MGWAMGLVTLLVIVVLVLAVDLSYSDCPRYGRCSS
jgi:hypothetical protein